MLRFLIIPVEHELSNVLKFINNVHKGLLLQDKILPDNCKFHWLSLTFLPDGQVLKFLI